MHWPGYILRKLYCTVFGACTGKLMFSSHNLLSMVALWSMVKKKPLMYQKHNSTSNNAGTCVCDTWVSSVTALPYSDLIASGVCVYVCMYVG